jgi:hypothetical protein
MDSLENDTIEFQSYGIFGVNDVGYLSSYQSML